MKHPKPTVIRKRFVKPWFDKAKNNCNKLSDHQPNDSKVISNRQGKSFPIAKRKFQKVGRNNQEFYFYLLKYSKWENSQDQLFIIWAWLWLKWLTLWFVKLEQSVRKYIKGNTKHMNLAIVNLITYLYSKLRVGSQISIFSTQCNKFTPAKGWTRRL